MKSKWIVILAILTSFSSIAFASGLDCFSAASPKVGRNRAIDLCRGAVDANPAQCLFDARAAHLTEIQAVALCASTTNASGPVACFARAKKLHLGDNQAIQLCRFSSNGFAAECYAAARDVLTENLAIDLCMQSLSIETVRCFNEARAAHLVRNDAIQLCQARKFQ